MIKPQNVNDFFRDGCGRCAKGGTPQCKVHSWTQELILLRNLCVESGLTETIKWGMPVYTHKGKNVAIIGAFKEFCTIGFFKGILLNDPDQKLQVSGENTQDSRILKFKHVQELLDLEPWIRVFLQDALEIEEKGIKPEKGPKKDLILPDEMLQFFKENPMVEERFMALTPGRQRSWVIFINGAKQSATRQSRLSKAVPKILEGKGMHD